MSLDWKNIIKIAAPVLGTALGGPAGGAALSILSQTILGKTGGTEEELATAIAGGLKPEVMLALKQADLNFKVEMRKMDVEEERVHTEDRKSARERETAAKDYTPRNLAYIFTIGFFAVLFAELYIGMNAVVIPEAAQRTLDITLGVLFAMMLGVKEYYYGSSAGSTAKTALLDSYMRKSGSRPE